MTTRDRMSSASVFQDFYVGVPRWRELLVWGKRRRGVWDPKKNKRETLVLRDGRKLSYFLDGPAAQQPQEPPVVDQQQPMVVDQQHSQALSHDDHHHYIFVFHGMFLSGNAFVMSRVPNGNYTLVCVHRPGYFGSSPVPLDTYDYREFARDVEQLAHHLQIPRFSVVGHSSGGPCALACAHHLGPTRVSALAILAGDPEYAVLLLDDDDHSPGAVFDCCMGCFLPRLMWWFGPTFRVANGLRNDFVLERRPYGFNTEDITQPALCVLAGKDHILPQPMARKVHDRLPNSELRILAGLGHNQLLRDDVLQMVFEEVTRLAQTPSPPPSPTPLSLSSSPSGTPNPAEKYPVKRMEWVLLVPPPLAQSAHAILAACHVTAHAWHLEGRYGSRTHGYTSQDGTKYIGLPVLDKSILIHQASACADLERLLDRSDVALVYKEYTRSNRETARTPPYFDARIHPERMAHQSDDNYDNKAFSWLPPAIENNANTSTSTGATFTYMELFAGIGGFGIALKALGGKCVLASEIDENCRRVFSHNFPQEKHVLHGDIYQITNQQLRNIRHHVDLLVGGFPCQPFSNLGDQPGLQCPKGHLFQEIVRVLRVVRPRAFLLENVPGLLGMTDTLHVIVTALQEVGYTVSYEVCNARGLTATSRKRLFLVGIYHGPGNHNTNDEMNNRGRNIPICRPFEFPYVPDLQLKAQHVIDYNCYNVPDEHIGEAETAEEILANMHDMTDAYTRAAADDEPAPRDEVQGSSNNLATAITALNSFFNTATPDNDEGDQHHAQEDPHNNFANTSEQQNDIQNHNNLHASINWNTLLPITDEQLSKLTNTSSKTWHATHSRWRPSHLAWPELPCQTIVSHYGNSVVRGTQSQLVPQSAYHQWWHVLQKNAKNNNFGILRSSNPRRFSPDECARIMGFPVRTGDDSNNSHRENKHPFLSDSWFSWPTTKSHAFQGDMAFCKEQYRMIGNAVCPPLIAALAGAVLAHTQTDPRWVEFGRQTAVALAYRATIQGKSTNAPRISDNETPKEPSVRGHE